MFFCQRRNPERGCAALLKSKAIRNNPFRVLRQPINRLYPRVSKAQPWAEIGQHLRCKPWLEIDQQPLEAQTDFEFLAKLKTEPQPKRL
jgi:hypothetical protein